MKLYKSIILGVALALSATSCNDWLDVNTDPNSPSAESVEYQTLLPWCQFYLSHCYVNTGSNAWLYTGYVFRPGTARDRGAALWNLSAATRRANTYQWWYVGVGSNLGNLYDKSMADGAYHYAAAARLIRAFGFMLQTDVFGEVPYTQAFGDYNSPEFDTGKTIFMGCLSDIDEAIELFGREQASGAKTLAEGDSWNSGDTSKWIKFAYLLKARWLNHLSKKSSGTWSDGKYDATEILACLDKAMTSNSDNTVIRHTDTNSATHDVLVWNEPVDYSTLYSCVGMNSNIYITKTYYDNLTNFDGKGIEDPRADHFIPWARSSKSDNTPSEIKWSDNGQWRRSLGADLQTNIYSNGSGPYASSWNNTTNSWYCNTSNAERLGDTVYVQMRTYGTGYAGKKDMLYRANDNNDASAMSSVFQVRPTSPTYLGTYWEAQFIRAEVYMRQGNTASAYEAYKSAIQANIEAVNSQLATWTTEDASLLSCPSFVQMEQEDIDNFLNNAIGTASDLTMGKIMTQKLISEAFMFETWNDFRRHDFDTEIFFNWDKSYEYKNTGTYKTYCPEGKGPRRWQPAAIEINYNSANLEAIGSSIPGVSELPSGTAWYNSDQVCTLNVWWDSTQE